MRPALLLALMLGTPAFAHEGRGHADPTVPLFLAAGALYAVGLTRLWMRAGAGRGLSGARAALFGTGYALAGILLLSPLDALAERLLAAHMVQHFGLMLLAAPLMVLGRPALAFLWALPASWRGAAQAAHPLRTLLHPLAAWTVYFAVLWLWHAPPLHEAALADPRLHALQHASFLGAALLFWSAVLGAPRGETRALAFGTVFATAVQSCALAALLTTSATVWYPAYPGAFGLSPLEDQQLGGLVMWVPCCAILIGAALSVMAGLLRDTERRAEEAR